MLCGVIGTGRGSAPYGAPKKTPTRRWPKKLPACKLILLTNRNGMDDEHQLREIQQQLARAWVKRDRAFIEGILAPEWSVTQANGSILSRANLLRSAFETGALRVTSMLVDDVSVRIFGTAAVVRGRTVATGTDKSLAIDVRLRFTDVFLKRNGEWQAVASHASVLAE